MTKSKKDPEDNESAEELISLAVAVDQLGILDSKRFYIMKKHYKEEKKTLSNWDLFFNALKLI